MKQLPELELLTCIVANEKDASCVLIRQSVSPGSMNCYRCQGKANKFHTLQ